MLKKIQGLYPLSQYLPFQFRNGSLIRQFSKPCLRCHKMLNSTHMHGLIRAIDNYAVLAARATCPSCQLNFNIACIITHTKEVRSIWLPAGFFRWYLQILPFTPRMPKPVIHPAQTIANEEGRTPSTSIASATPSFKFDRSEENVGYYNDKPIPAYIIVAQESIPFYRISVTGAVEDPSEYLIDQHLIYKKNI